jgi:hypothetical protein
MNAQTDTEKKKNQQEAASKTTSGSVDEISDATEIISGIIH